MRSRVLKLLGVLVLVSAAGSMAAPVRMNVLHAQVAAERDVSAGWYTICGSFASPASFLRACARVARVIGRDSGSVAMLAMDVFLDDGSR